MAFYSVIFLLQFFYFFIIPCPPQGCSLIRKVLILLKQAASSLSCLHTCLITYMNRSKTKRTFVARAVSQESVVTSRPNFCINRTTTATTTHMHSVTERQLYNKL